VELLLHIEDQVDTVVMICLVSVDLVP